MSFKIHTYAASLVILEDRIKSFQSALTDLSEGAKNDAKSTAGDKHETAMAMMQIEREKISKQLSELLDQKETLQRLEQQGPSAVAAVGSLLHTNRGYLYLTIPLGRVVVENEPVMVISAQSPLGVKLIGLPSKATAEINGTSYRIEEIL